MKIIGEKINGTRKKVAAAIAERDVAFIQQLAIDQTEAGSSWLDVNAGTSPVTEPDDLVWLVKAIQEVTALPLCLDSGNPEALNAALKAVDRTPMINSINGEQARLDNLVPLVAEHGCEVIALCLGSARIPETPEGRMEVLRPVLARTREAGIPDDKIYVDPLCMAVSTDNNAALTTVATMRAIRAEYPLVHFTMGLSNVSFGLPARTYVNRALLILAMQAGLDSAIIDPMDKGIMATMLAADVVLGQDKHCLRYVRAARKGAFDVPATTVARTPAPSGAKPAATFAQ